MAEYVGKISPLRDMFIYPGTHLYNIYITYGPKLLTIWVIYAMWGKRDYDGGLWRLVPLHVYISKYLSITFTL